MVLRVEGAHRRRQGLGPGTHAGNDISDISQTPVLLLHGQAQAVWLDAGYVGVGHASAARPLKSWPKDGGKDWCTPTRNSRSK
ncbi:MAG: hypothetical protein ABIW02_02055 [Nitrosospira sp.]